MFLLPKEAALFASEGQEEGGGDTHENGTGKNGTNGQKSQNLGKHGQNGFHHTRNGQNTHKRDEAAEAQKKAVEKQKNGIVWRIHAGFNKHFERMRAGYKDRLIWALDHRLGVSLVFAGFCILSFCLYPFIGRDFFPQVDAGQFRLHVRVPPSTRLEETAKIFSQIEDQIHKTVPASETGLVLDNIGEPVFVNLAYGDSATVGPSDGEILVTLKPGHHATEGYVQALRRALPKQFPDETFFFQPADIVNQILNFGLPAPIDVQVSGPAKNSAADLALAHQLQSKIAGISGAADVHLQQITDAPSLRVDVDRTRAAQVGLTQQNVSQSLLVSLAGTGTAAPNYFLNQQNGVVYSVTVQTPQYRLDSPEALLNTPISAPGQSQPQLLSNLATISHDTSALVISHYNIQPTYDIYASPQNRDLGGVSGDISKVISTLKKQTPKGTTVTVRGQVQSMNTSFGGLTLGLLGAIVLVYLLLAINFQSWLDPLVVVSGAPGALAGILWMLFTTQTTLNVPSLTGAIMTIGVSTANSVLVVTFANERRAEGMSALDAVIDAGFTRLRPVLMTALAMILGMIPMALALGEGGEQNAPLGRAVIGGLLVATLTTLFIVPISYSVLRKSEPKSYDEDDAPKPTPAKRRHPTQEEAAA